MSLQKLPNYILRITLGNIAYYKGPPRAAEDGHKMKGGLKALAPPVLANGG
jgi:hypothetical protein